MNGNSLFLDTNVILYLLDGDVTLADLLHGKKLYVSVITELELLGFKGIDSKEEKAIADFLSHCVIINLNSFIKGETIRIRKQYGMKLPDSIICATSIYLNIPIITSDTDFRKVSELNLVSYEK